MKCPDCAATELVREHLGEREAIDVDRCPHCHGCWLDAKALERMEAGVWSSVDALDLSVAEPLSARTCPRCAARLATVNPDDHRELAIDRCPSCHGLWLDPGELERLHEVAVQHAADHGGLHRRPDGWSRLRWATWRVAERWQRSHEE